jgi:hypothetical protein
MLENTELVQQYFMANGLSINQTKMYYILFHTQKYWEEGELKILIKNREILNTKSIQTQQCREEGELKILIKNREIINIKSNNFHGTVTIT